MYNYNPYQYTNNFNPYNQNSIQQMEQIRDQWDAKIQLAQQQQNQMQQQPQITPTQPITQNFQLAPQTNNNSELEGRYADNIDEVKNTFVMKTGVFVTKDFSTLFIKDVSGNIRTFTTEEVIPKDDKDLKIQSLEDELERMKTLMTQNIQATSVTEEIPVIKRKTTSKK